MNRAPNIAIDISRRRLRAVHVMRDGDAVRVERVLAVDVPSDLDLDNVDAAGAWLRDQLRNAEFPTGRAIFAVSREHVALKRLTLPTDDVYELPDMVRLSMQRELPFDASEAVIDFVTTNQQPGQTVVVAAALRSSYLDAIRNLCNAANLKLERISLRCMGVTALLQTLTAEVDHSRAWLAVDITNDGVELSVVTDEGLRFSRAAEVTHAGEHDEFVDAVITETRRSWMSYRIVEDAPAVSEAFVFGEADAVRSVTTPVRELLDVRTEAIESHPRVNAAGHDLQTTWPLIGLFVESYAGEQSFDFARPRQAPDRHARTRKFTIMAAGAVALCVALLFMFGKWNLDALNHEAETLEKQVRALGRQHYRYERETKRIEHLALWESSEVDWLSHLLALENRLPPTSEMVLEKWTGSLRFQGVDYNSRAEKDQRWSAPKEITIAIEGEATDQSIVDQFRKSFVESREYELRPTGPDTQGGTRYPFPFKLTLRTTDSTAPISEDAPADETEEQSKAGTETRADATSFTTEDGGTGST